MSQSERCPDCGGEVRWEYTCHTYPGPNNMFWACQGCASAIEYFCWGEDECNWEYVHGLNPGNPRAESNEQSRPSWLTADDDSLLSGAFAPHAKSSVRGVYDAESV